MKNKTLLNLSLILCLLISTTSCSSNVARPIIDEAEIELWTYPVGDWGNEETVTELINGFTASHPEIKVKVKFLLYNIGDREIEEAIGKGEAPDIVLEGPERLVANWGARGLMVDLSDLYNDASKDIYENVVNACRSDDGKYYEYPLCVVTHCMAINKRIFEEADALQYVNLTNHSWTTEDFFKAANAIYNSGHEEVLSIYCNGPSGDQGSRALVTNLYGGSFTDKTHQQYTINSSKNILALTELNACNGITIDSQLDSNGEIARFRQGELAMSICWNPGMQLSIHKSTPKTFTGDEIIPMQFPSPNGISKLASGIWGFGIFDNKDENKIKAAKIFIDYMANDPNGVKKAVKASRAFPAHKELAGLYDDTDISKTMRMFLTDFMPSMGDYYQITPGWVKVRSLWTSALQSIERGKDIKKTLTKCNNEANELANKANTLTENTY
jgi:hypothetical protein